MLESTAPGLTLQGYLDRLKNNGIVFSPQTFLAGGSIRRAVCGHSIEEGDFDIFIAADWNFDEAMKLYGWAKMDKVSKRELNMVTYDMVIDKLHVQLHYVKEKPTITSILKTFDFTCCQFAYDGEKVRYLDSALQDAKNLVLRYTGSAGQFTSARAFRMMEMGFKANCKTLHELQSLAALPVAATQPGKLGRS